MDLTGWQDASLNNLDISGNVTLKGANSKFIGDVSGNADTADTLTSYWNQIGSDIDGKDEDNNSGHSVSLSADGTIVAIGAIYNDDNGTLSGHVRVFQYTGNSWGKLGQDISGANPDDKSGYSVSLSSNGTIVAIGAPYYDNNNGSNSGHVRVYEYNDNTWEQLGQDISGADSHDRSGHSVSLSSDGKIVAIGAPYNSGHVRVYEYNDISWEPLGQDIIGADSHDRSGYSVSLSSNGTIVAIGATQNDDNGDYSGHVRVYEYNVGTEIWEKIGDDISGEYSYDTSGYSVSLSSNGTIVAIGAPLNDGSNNTLFSGHVRVYEYDVGTEIWEKIGDDIDGENAGDRSGYSVSLSSNGTIVAIGATENDGDDGTNTKRGHVRVYKYISGEWTKIGYDIDGENEGDQCGHSVSLSSDGKDCSNWCSLL